MTKPDSLASAIDRLAARREFRIGEWILDAHHHELRRGGDVARLEPKVIQVLAHLARQPGVAVSREELLSAVWPGVIVGDDALTQAIIKLRKALGDDAHKPAYIETISKRGYRLIARVEAEPTPAPGATIAEPALAPGPTSPRRVPRGVKALVATVLLLAAGWIAFAWLGKAMPWPLRGETKGGTSSPFATIAVLPLANLSGDAKREYFSDGMTEDLINALGRFEGVRVMSPNAVQPFKGKPATPWQIGNELDVRYIVQGSVREADGRLRVAVTLA